MHTASLRGIDLEDLRALCCAAEAGSIGRAAIALGVSQPAVSKRIASLERRTGVSLLDRTARGVRLTPAGRRVYQYAVGLLERAAALERLLEAARAEVHPLRLAASHSAREAFVDDFLARLHDEGGPLVELFVANSQIVRRLVADGSADIGVAARRPGATPNPSVEEREICPDELVCAVPRAHPWAVRGTIALAEFLSTPLVVRDPGSNSRWCLQSALEAASLPAPTVLTEAATPAAAVQEALRHNAPMLESRRVVERYRLLQVVRVEQLQLPRSYELVLPASAEPTARVRALAERIAAAAARPQAVETDVDTPPAT